MKKLTAGIFTVLMGLVSVNAADAAVASQGYVDFKVGENTTAISGLSETVQANKTAADAVADRVTTAEGKITTAEGKITTAEGKITTLEGKVSTMEGGNLTIKDGAITEAKLATELATKINAKADQSALDAVSAVANAAQTEAQVDDAIDDKIEALNLGEIYQTKGNLSTEIPENNASADKYTSESAVAEYVDVKMGALSDSVGLINNSINNLSGRVDTIEDEKNGILAQAKADATAKANTAQTNAEATAAGALSAAKSELEAKIDDKANSADVYTKTEADTAFLTSDEVEDKIEAAVADNGAVKTVVDTAISNLENGAVKNNADAIKAIQDSDYAKSGITAEKVLAYEAYDAAIKANATAAANAATAATTAETSAKEYALGKANDALTASVQYTDAYITSLGLQQIASVPVECSDNANYCTLTANNSGFAWEVIARVEGETVEGRTAVTSKATAKPTAPSALTE